MSSIQQESLQKSLNLISNHLINALENDTDTDMIDFFLDENINYLREDDILKSLTKSVGTLPETLSNQSPAHEDYPIGQSQLLLG